MTDKNIPEYGFDAEHGFLPAIHSAARAFSGHNAHFRRESRNELKPLLDYLLSDRPINVGERHQLVLLLSGEEYALREGGPLMSNEEMQRQQCMFSDFRSF